MNNADLKAMIRSAGLAQWRVALEVGISENTLIRWFRTELPPEKQERIYQAIKNLERGDLNDGRE